jgi:hypothetical protein
MFLLSVTCGGKSGMNGSPPLPMMFDDGKRGEQPYNKDILFLYVVSGPQDVLRRWRDYLAPVGTGVSITRIRNGKTKRSPIVAGTGELTPIKNSFKKDLSDVLSKDVFYIKFHPTFKQPNQAVPPKRR